MYIHIPYPFTCGSKTRELPNNTGSNFKPLLTLLERRSQEWGRDGWFCTHLLCSFSLYTFCSLLLTILLLCNNYNSLHAFESSRTTRWSQQPTISVAFCSKGRMIVYDKSIRIQPGHMIQSLCYLQGGGDCLLVECEFHFSFNFVFAPDIVQLLSSHGYKFTGKPKLWFWWGVWLDCEMD